MTREELQKQLWTDGAYVDSNHGLNAAVNKLRDALRDSAEEPKYIETLPRRGYRFIGTIQSELSQAVQPAVIPVTAAVTIPTPIPSVREERGKTARANQTGPNTLQLLRRRLLRGEAGPSAWCSLLAQRCCFLELPVAVFLSRNQEMAENILRIVRKYVAENLASAASRQLPPQEGEAAFPKATTNAAGCSAAQGGDEGLIGSERKERWE